MGRLRIEKEVYCKKCKGSIALALELFDCSPNKLSINVMCNKCQYVNKFNKKNILELPKEKRIISEDYDSDEEDVQLDITPMLKPDLKEVRYIN